MKNSKIAFAFITGVVITCLLGFTISRENEEDKSLARVAEIDGKYVFMGCTPVQPYETAFEFKTVVHNMGGCPSISEMAKATIESAKKKGFPFDAVIAGDTKFDLAIKFK